MKYSFIALLSTLLIIVSMSCKRTEHDDVRGMGSSAIWIDVTVNGKQHYGLAYKEDLVRNKELISKCSCVVIAPGNRRTVESIQFNGNESNVKLTRGEFKLLGRKLCISDTNGTRLTIYPDDIPVEAFKDLEHLKNTIRKIIEKAEQSADSTPSAAPQPPSNATH